MTSGTSATSARTSATARPRPAGSASGCAARYGDLRALGEAWHRHSFADWDDVTPPRAIGPYPDTLDWLQFRIDNAYALMRWRAELIRAIDPAHASPPTASPAP